MFTLNLNSIYDITGTDVTVYSNGIIIAGQQVVGTVYEFIIPDFYDSLPPALLLFISGLTTFGWLTRRKQAN
jgi:hypothetical protein